MSQLLASLLPAIKAELHLSREIQESLQVCRLRRLRALV